jgi:hypothetical protein
MTNKPTKRTILKPRQSNRILSQKTVKNKNKPKPRQSNRILSKKQTSLHEGPKTLKRTDLKPKQSLRTTVPPKEPEPVNVDLNFNDFAPMVEEMKGIQEIKGTRLNNYVPNKGVVTTIPKKYIAPGLRKTDEINFKKKLNETAAKIKEQKQLRNGTEQTNTSVHVPKKHIIRIRKLESILSSKERELKKNRSEYETIRNKILRSNDPSINDQEHATKLQEKIRNIELQIKNLKKDIKILESNRNKNQNSSNSANKYPFFAFREQNPSPTS